MRCCTPGIVTADTHLPVIDTPLNMGFLFEVRGMCAASPVLREVFRRVGQRGEADLRETDGGHAVPIRCTQSNPPDVCSVATFLGAYIRKKLVRDSGNVTPDKCRCFAIRVIFVQAPAEPLDPGVFFRNPCPHTEPRHFRNG